ncbi:unnamed protein product [Dibothriocephalus latus]|uniref:Lysosomal amino acid transporter 1 homolog n=1 Tax=Dibothriocephalus latus TaxID=60516 RepID=A0A3P6PCN2_DIBLA|nr:unnamed protein product [Dibothriocephalus latus]
MAGYTVCIDIVLIVQYVYYLCLHKHKVKKYGGDYMNKKNEEESVTNSTPTKSLATAMLGIVGISCFYMPAVLSGEAVPPHLAVRHLQGRQLLQADPMTTTPDPWDSFLATKEEKIGYGIGWVGTVMYFCSRVPQIVQNCKRRSTEGLSFTFFALAIFGNIFYGLQIFIKSTDQVFLMKSLPWILGSLGILIFDFIIIGQFFAFRHNKADATVLDEGDEFGSRAETEDEKYSVL